MGSKQDTYNRYRSFEGRALSVDWEIIICVALVLLLFIVLGVAGSEDYKDALTQSATALTAEQKAEIIRHQRVVLEDGK